VVIYCSATIIVPLLVACAGQAPAPVEETPTPSEEPAMEESTPTPTAIPHTLEGRADFLMCHSSGTYAVPVDHAGRTNDTCIACHNPTG